MPNAAPLPAAENQEAMQVLRYVNGQKYGEQLRQRAVCLPTRQSAGADCQGVAKAPLQPRPPALAPRLHHPLRPQSRTTTTFLTTKTRRPRWGASGW